jgi:two-component system LytT family response regulator
MPEQLRVLVVDDEPLGRERLLDLLATEVDVEVVGTAGSGREAVAAIRSARPDVVFLDVQMPGLTGLDVVREVGPDAMPAIVFVTAYDRHALDAFELAALDYLLKPFEDERFRQALARAREVVRLREVDAVRGRLITLLGGAEAPAQARAVYLERIAVEMRGQVRVVPVDRIDYIEADGPYAVLHAAGETFAIRERMQTLEERLDPARFVRVHRSAIVQLDRVEALLVAAGGDYNARLRDGTRVKVARGRRDALAERLGMPPA